MKKLFLLLTAALPLFATAQDKVKFGINGGMTLSDFRGGEYADELKYGFNYLIGMSAEIPLSDKVSFSTGLNYEKKSPTQKITFEEPIFDPVDPAFSTGTARFTTTLHYLTVPLNIKLYLGSKKNFYLTGGAFAAILLDSALRVDGDKIDDSNNNGFKTMDAGINLGFGTRIKLTETQNLNIELRDNLGFVNISKSPYPGYDEMRTNSINLIANWQFDL